MSRLTISQQLSDAVAKIDHLLSVKSGLETSLAAAEARVQLLEGELNSLRERVATIPEKEEKIAQLTKDLENKNSSYSYISAEKTKYENEIEQAHAVLDGVDGAPTREYERDYGKGYRNVVTRLAGAFLAISQKGSQK